MRTTHRMLLRIWYDPDCDFAKITIGYLNRGAPGNYSILSGKEVIRLENRYMVLHRFSSSDEEVYIPYHRIWWLAYDGQIIWSKSF